MKSLTDKLTMKRSFALAVLAVLLVPSGLVALWLKNSADPRDAEERTQPPPLVEADLAAGEQLLFEGVSVDHWRIDGPYQTNSATLELGGDQPVRATLVRELAEGESLDFDYFQTGQAGAALWFNSHLLSPQDPDPAFCQPFAYDLNLSEFYYRRWHNVKSAAGRQGDNTTVDITTRAHFDEVGRGGGKRNSMPARGGCKYELVFEVPAGSKLYLRNVLLHTNPAAEAARATP